MERRLPLYVVVLQGATILELPSREYQAILVWWNPFLVLNHSLDVLNRVTLFNIQRDSLSCQRLDKDDLLIAEHWKDQVKSAFMLNVIVL